MSTGLIVIVVIVALVVIGALVGFGRPVGGFYRGKPRRYTDTQRAAAEDVAEVRRNDEYNPNAPGNNPDDL